MTVVGLPLAILTFVWEQRKERRNEEEEIFQRLSDEYREFLKLVLDNADLHLLRRESSRVEFTEEQKERRLAIFGILISLFERAYLLVYEDKMDKQTRRMWQSWEDYMREWGAAGRFSRRPAHACSTARTTSSTRYMQPAGGRAAATRRRGTARRRLLGWTAHLPMRNRGPAWSSATSIHRFHSVFSFGTLSGSSSSLPAAETTS